jgi:beta-galactosidase
LAGYEKPLYYQRKALWTEAPFARIAVSSAGEKHPGPWHERFCWQGEPGEKKLVACYTNAKEAELFLNGKSLGKKQLTDADGCRACWEVDYEPGVLRAAANGAEDSLSTVRAASRILVKTDAEALRADGQSVAQAEICLVDENGRPALDELLLCQPVGEITLLGIENGKPDDLTPYSENRRTTLNGRAIAYLRAGTVPGKAVFHVRAASGLEAECVINLR